MSDENMQKGKMSVEIYLYVDENQKLAFIRHKPEVVYVFRDVGPASLGFAIYVDTNATFLPTRPANGDKGIHSN